jgi:hypothetical protein
MDNFLSGTGAKWEPKRRIVIHMLPRFNNDDNKSDEIGDACY